uniref:PDZ domain-containing protein n=1 Tax=Parastrongyloides trichosuri TaxID=131310 RepID=A0A0N4Z297_PARTI
MDVSAFFHTPGQPLECLSLAVELRKEIISNTNNEVVYKVGLKIGGGIDQDPNLSPFKYPDNGIYITSIDPQVAQKSGLRKHDKILQVNGHDFTMITHEKAVKYIKKYPVLNILVARNNIPPVASQTKI